MNIIKKFRGRIPEKSRPQFDQVMAVLDDPKVRSYLADKEIANDIQVISGEVIKTMQKFGAETTDKGLKEIFNTAANVGVQVATDYVLNGKLGMGNAAKVAKVLPRAPSMMKTFKDVTERKDPVLEQLRAAMENNETVVAAALRIAVKAEGALFRLEKDDAGQGYLVDLVTGSGLRFPIPKEDYDETVTRLAEARKKGTPPSPGL